LFTDLDGTLLDSGYSYKKALPALKLVRERQIPLIICSSKTRREIEVIRKRLRNDHPFVSENGGGIFIPKNYFPHRFAPGNHKVITGIKSRKCCAFHGTNSKYKVEETEEYYLIKLGADYADLREALNEIKGEGFNLKGFGDMSIREVSCLTGLSNSAAKMARQRDFDETFVFEGGASAERKLRQRIKSMGLNYTRGEYHHIMGGSDKGMAVAILKRLYKKQNKKFVTAAFGDSPNDIEMLERADRAFVVKKENGRYNLEVIKKVKGCKKAGGIGPEGWNKAVLELIDEFQ
jgi:mannosyl-3-phosphoglycerate phosphatase